MNVKKAIQFAAWKKIHINGNIFFYVSLLVIAIITFYPLFYTGLACGDDMAAYLVTRFGKVFTNAKDLAEMHGRFQYLLVLPVQSLPYVWDNMFVVKLFQVLPILLSLYLFYRILLSWKVSRELSGLYVLLFLVTTQVSRHTSLFVTYPFFFTFSFSILLLSFLLILRYQRSHRYVILVFSAVLFAIGLVFYEMYLLFILFAAISLVYHNFRTGCRGLKLIKQTALQFLPFFIVAAVYMTIYVVYRNNHHSMYDGNRIAATADIVKSLFKVLWGLSYTAIPLTVYDSTHYLFKDTSQLIGGYMNVVPYLFAYARVEWFIKAILVFSMSYFLIIRIPRTAPAFILAGIPVSLMLIFLPHLPLAITEKYIYYVTCHEMRGYVTTFYSLFGVVMLLTVLTGLLSNLTGNFTLLRHITALALSVSFVFCSFLTDFSNYYITRDIDKASTRLYAVDELLLSEKFKAIPQKSNMYGAALWNNISTQAYNLTAQNFQWSDYIIAKSGICQYIYSGDQAFLEKAKTSQDPSYSIVFRQSFKSDDALLAIAELKQPGENDVKVDSVSRKILIEYYSPYKYFTVSFKKQPSPDGTNVKFKVNHINGETGPGEYASFTIFNTNRNERATIFILEGLPVIINSIQISTENPAGLEIFYL